MATAAWKISAGIRENFHLDQADYFADELLMSTTDSRRSITHCNAAFERVSRLTVHATS